MLKFLIFQGIGLLLLLAICRMSSRRCPCPRCTIPVPKCDDTAFEASIKRIFQ